MAAAAPKPEDTLAQAKSNSVNELVSKALADKQISDVEFHIITREVEKYHELKAAIRSGVKAVTQEAATQTQGPDIEKLKEELRKEVKKEFQKKSFKKNKQHLRHKHGCCCTKT